MSQRDYRCYLADEADRIRAVQNLTCEDDAAAMLQAEQILAASTHRVAEIWQRSRMVGKLVKAQQSAGPGGGTPSGSTGSDRTGAGAAGRNRNSA